MSRTLFTVLLAVVAGCASTDSRDAKEYRKLTDEVIERLVEKLERWSMARESDDHVLEGLLKRDLRREAGRMIEPLKLGLASHETDTRAICAAALGFSEDVSSIPLLVTTLRDEDPAVRANAMLSLCMIGSIRTPLDPVLAAMSDPSPEVRRHAVFLLGILAAPENVNTMLPELMKAMGDTDAEVRENSSHALERVGDPRSARILAESGLLDSSARVRLNSAVALGRMKASDAVPDLVRALKREMNKSVSREIVSALSLITGKNLGSDVAAWESETIGTGLPR